MVVLGWDVDEIAPLSAIDRQLASVVAGTEWIGGDGGEEQEESGHAFLYLNPL
jgi:hypothetical protein